VVPHAATRAWHRRCAGGNGVDLDRFDARPQGGDSAVAARYGLRPGAPLWLLVGGVEERKNTRRAFEAFCLHRRAWPTAQLAIVGGASLLDHGAYQLAFRDAVAASDVQPIFTGAVADAEMAALYRLADGLLMPSLREGFGLVVLEALVSGTPAVVSRQPPFTEYLDDEVAWCDALDAHDIAAAMDRALAAPPAAVPDVCRRHSWAASAARHVTLYRALRALA